MTVTVDNVNYTAPQSFQWGAGTSHSIAAPSPQNGITGGQYLFSGWSDGGAVAHSITVPSTPATYSASFSVVNFPLTITGISPAAAPVGGQVTITGTNFGSTAGTVTFHGTAATPASWTATSITVNVPSGASSGPVLVSAGGLDSNEWNFNVVPSVISVSPTSGSAGTQVTILGSGFGATPGTVWLGSTPGSVVSWNSSQIVATVAANAVSGVAEVQQSGFSSNSVPFTVATPTISSLSSTNVLPGAQVTISGSGFGAAQGNGQVWLGTAYGSVQSWSNTQIVAAVASGSMSGNARVLQGGVWSNAVGLSIDALQITGITPNSGTAGTSVTFTGTGFGSQSTGAVWLGSMAGNVVSWTDTQVVATVASGSLSGIARIQQNGAWSNAKGFTVPGGGGNSLTPAMINMVVGDAHAIQATDASGQSVTGLTWASSNTSVVSLSTDDPPILTALAPGHVTITAGTGSADVTVSALGVLPNGTVLWSNPGDGSGVQQILPAVPSQAGVADVFALQNDGKIQAMKSDGTVAWTSDVSAYVVGGFFNGVLHTTADWGTDDADVAGAGVRPNFQGGITFRATNCNDDALRCALVTLDGGTGQVVSTYTPAGGNQNFGDFLIHTDGTIFNLEMDGNDDLVVTGIDSSSGTAKFSALLYQSSVDERSVSDGGGQQDWIGPHANPIVAGDGYAYWPWIRVVPGGSLDQNGNVAYSWTEHVMLFRVNSSGSSDNIDLMDWISSTDLINHSGPTDVSITTNADQGVIVNWYTPATGVGGMAVTAGTSFAIVSTPSVPGQATAAFNVLQAQDGSFVGSVGAGDPDNPQYNMVAFDGSGNIRWMVPNDQPQIATAEGGVIGQSGVTYDQNGSATGQRGLAPIYGWGRNAYQIGSVDEEVAEPLYEAMTYWPVQGGNDSNTDTATLRKVSSLAIETLFGKPLDCYSSVGSSNPASYAQRNINYQAVDQYNRPMYHMSYQEQLVPLAGSNCPGATTPQQGLCIGQWIKDTNEFEDTLSTNPLTGHTQYTQVFWLATPANTPYYAAFFGQIPKINAYQPTGPTSSTSLNETQFVITVNGNTGLNSNGVPIRRCQ